MDIINTLKEKYNLAPDSYCDDNPFKIKTEWAVDDGPFCDLLVYKWKGYYEVGWYGISLGWPVPNVWYLALDDFLEYVKSECPEFKILQISLKFGYVKIYLSNTNQKINEECWLLSGLLKDKNLIY